MKQAFFCKKSGHQVIMIGEAQHPDTHETVVVYEGGFGVLRYMHPREFYMHHVEVPIISFDAIRKEGR